MTRRLAGPGVEIRLGSNSSREESAVFNAPENELKAYRQLEVKLGNGPFHFAIKLSICLAKQFPVLKQDTSEGAPRDIERLEMHSHTRETVVNAPF